MPSESKLMSLNWIPWLLVIICEKKEIIKDKENIYIIDTNVFVDHPDIISKIDRKYSIILSAKVIDELDYLKISLKIKQSLPIFYLPRMGFRM